MKFLQARHVFELSGLEVVQFVGHKAAYEETYEGGPRALMNAAIAEVRRRPGGSSVFFVEDTSIRVEALSTGASDFPGLAAKEWFLESSFEELDAELRLRGNDRRASVTSRIALSVPHLSRPIHISETVAGEIASSLRDFTTNPLYPWLNAKDFSSWFVPAGSSSRCLGEMSIDESYSFDARTLALSNLVERLEEYSVVVALPSHCIRVHEPAADLAQLSLFSSVRARRNVVILGLMCSGKSSAAQWLSSDAGYFRVEASGLIDAASDMLGIPSAASKAARAKLLFAIHGPAAVEERMIESVAKIAEQADRAVVYGGLRTLEGLEVAIAHLGDPIVLTVAADDRLRFERCLRRSRAGDPTDWQSFVARDDIDFDFGLLDVASHVSDFTIRNDHAYEDFISAMRNVVSAKQPLTADTPLALYKLLSFVEAANGHVGEQLFRREASRLKITASSALRRAAVRALSFEDGSGSLTSWGESYLRLIRRRAGAITAEIGRL